MDCFLGHKNGAINGSRVSVKGGMYRRKAGVKWGISGRGFEWFCGWNGRRGGLRRWRADGEVGM
jgi:hypothetical protein